jgi:hypothetical protein
MMREPNEEGTQRWCPEFEERIVLYATGELEGVESEAVVAHLGECAGCAAALERERRLLGAVTESAPGEPDERLLASCRASLADALDQKDERGAFARWVWSVVPRNWFVLHPAWSAAALLLIGFTVGSLAPYWMNQAKQPSTTTTAPAAATNSAGLLNDADLRAADVAAINWTAAPDNAPPRVEVELNAQRPMVVQGTVNNNNVKQLLLYVLQHNERFEPDVRLDSVELLRPRCNDADVREALCKIVHADRNPAVRLKALEALKQVQSPDSVRQTLLDVLMIDVNPGVRIEAVNALREMAEKGAIASDPHTLDVLRDRMQKDPNNYIRLQSAAAIRGLGPREKY